MDLPNWGFFGARRGELNEYAYLEIEWIIW
jgi:hypothetical protein